MVSIDFIKHGIRKAIAERPSRLTHGNTATNAFWIAPDGSIWQYNKLASIPFRSGLIGVHSHSPENWKAMKQKLALDPFNAGDMKALQWAVKRGYSNTYALISADGWLDVVYISDKAKSLFVRLTIKHFKEIDPSYAERERLWKEFKIGDIEQHRMALRSFIKKYGFVYYEGIRWK